MPPVIDDERCTLCGLCIEYCPGDVLAFEATAGGERVGIPYADECWHCSACVFDCPEEAIRIVMPYAML
ncbi:MAG: ferredoxin family protein [Chloroflexi bacterium]|nr:ferredoxin family protein [Chloroflexota bacterium]